MFDTWHSLGEVWDDALDSEIHENEVLIRNDYKKEFDFWIKRFAPSSANSDARELYLKLLGAKRDKDGQQPHQGRWTRMGTALGDTLQRDLLFIEKHYRKQTGKQPAFIPTYEELTDKNGENPRFFPRWEKFAQTLTKLEHNGEHIEILGQPDGILRHKSGKLVGLEIKSKQTTSAQTSFYSLREPKKDHFKQVVVYSIMYGIDDFIICYGNLSKKGWDMKKEDYDKTPDLRAFHVQVTEQDRRDVLDYFAEIARAVRLREMPPMDIRKWTFNNYKKACALSLTEEEIEEFKREAIRADQSDAPQFVKDEIWNAINEIERIRRNE